MGPLRSRPPAREIWLGDGPDRLYVREVGTGHPVVVLHGGPDFDHEYLLPELDRLADRCRLVYFDQRGRGRSSSGVAVADVSIESEVADLERVCEHVGAAQVALLGHSWGALLALEHARRHPGRVSHLILLNSAPVSHAGLLDLRRALAACRTDAERAELDAIRLDPRLAAGDRTLDARYHRIHFAPTVPAERLDELVSRLRRGVTESGIVAARAIEARLVAETWAREDYDLVPMLHTIECPTLLIHGDRDFIPLDVVRPIADAIEDARLIVLEDCGHFTYLEQPERVHDLVVGHLDAT